MRKKAVRYLLMFLGVPLVVLLGTVVFADKQYAWISLAVAVLSCVPFFYRLNAGTRRQKK